jgi:uncharacterized small protein (DUF1192 family)
MFEAGGNRAEMIRCIQEQIMPDESNLSRPELDDRIAILRDNIWQLTEQAVASLGAADEARTADRIAEQQEELNRCIEQRDLLARNRG